MCLSFLLPILVFAVGIYLLFKLRFFFILHPFRTVKAFTRSAKDPESRRALFLALAGTLGVGNIFGVAAGIIYGGAGSVFWLAVSSVFAMVIKYSECVVSFDYLGDGCGGMHCVLRRCFPLGGKILSSFYAALCIALSLFMGAAMQSASAAAVAGESVSIGARPASLIFTAAVLFGIVGGCEKIARITEKLIPLTMIVYIILSFSAIFLNIHRFFEVIREIIDDAFSFDAAVGGGVSFLFSRQISEGFARGILSNEAGCGTSSLAHTKSGDRTPHEAGVSGIAEVFFDTSLLCMLTAFMILLATPYPRTFSSPMALVSDAVVGTLGKWAGVPLTLSIFVFAYSTVICWYSYGAECGKYIFGKPITVVFLPLFLAFVLFGAYLPTRALISVTDALMLFLCLLTLSVLVKRSESIKALCLEE